MLTNFLPVINPLSPKDICQDRLELHTCLSLVDIFFPLLNGEVFKVANSKFSMIGIRNIFVVFCVHESITRCGLSILDGPSFIQINLQVILNIFTT